MSQDPRTKKSAAAGVPEDVRDAWSAMATDEPPALLDQAVLNKARAAVAPAATKRPWSFGWLHTATTAAVILLGVTLTLQLRDEAPGAGDLPPVPRPANGPDAAAPAMDAVAERALRTAPPVSTAGAALEETQDATLDAASDPAFDPAIDSRLDAGFDAAATIAEEALEDAAAAPREERPATLQALEIASDAQPGTPEAWLEDIRRLVAEGDLEAARASLAEFRSAWPDHPVPPDLLP